MRVCLILEGCYPYIRGGVSAWAHDYILSNPQVEFVLWTIHAARKYTGKALYELPENIVETHEIYLEDAVAESESKRKKTKGGADCVECLRMILKDERVDWDKVFDICSKPEPDIHELVSSEEFYDFCREISDEDSIGLADAYYGMKSIFLPLLFLVRQDVPEADIYHSAVAGYGGVLGALARFKTSKPFVLTEHGIYPREREEELIQADWVASSMRDMWIQSFYRLSDCAYRYADKVSALFQDAVDKQVEIGCDRQKCTVVSNGIHIAEFENIPLREPSDEVNIGAFVRYAPIKDIKTLIYAFYELQKKVQNARLYIMGGTDDEVYRQECIELTSRLNTDNICIEGYVDTVEYMKKMDFTIMTSISEGQPLAILESLAASRPCIVTMVGNCPKLINEPSDGCGAAGICCHPMDTKAIAQAMEKLCSDRALRLNMGENGRKRVRMNYTHEKMNSGYLDIYSEVL